MRALFLCFAALSLVLSACGDPIQIVNTTADVGGPDVSTDVGGPVSCSTDSDCPAQLECQVPTCEGGVCAYPIAADKCLADGICYNAGATLASDQCKICDPSATQEGLVNKECAANETCNPSGGVCESDNPLAAQCGACVDDTGCEAGLSCTALGGGAGKFCTKTCTDSAECGDGFACAEVDGASLCVLSTGGCATDGSACAVSADCEDLNPCTTGTCSSDACSFAFDDTVTEACYTGEATTRGVGSCADGTRTCSSGAFGACEGEVLPEAADSCGDGVDNDCDGTPDQDCNFTSVDLAPVNAVVSGPLGTSGDKVFMTFDATPVGPKSPSDAPLKVDFGIYAPVY